jgi:hypothetical protein
VRHAESFNAKARRSKAAKERKSLWAADSVGRESLQAMLSMAAVRKDRLAGTLAPPAIGIATPFFG